MAKNPIELIPHGKKIWPSGQESYRDTVHLLADECGRQEVTIAGGIEAQNYMPIYAFIAGQHEFGLDPWCYVEGIDQYRDGDRADIWFENGSCTTVELDNSPIRLFVDSKNL